MLKENRLLPNDVVIFSCQVYSSDSSSTFKGAKVGRSRFSLKYTNSSNIIMLNGQVRSHRDICYKQLTPVFVTYSSKRTVPQNSKNNDIIWVTGKKYLLGKKISHAHFM